MKRLAPVLGLVAACTGLKVAPSDDAGALVTNDVDGAVHGMSDAAVDRFTGGEDSDAASGPPCEGRSAASESDARC